MKTKEQLLDELCGLIHAEFAREIVQLKRKLKRATEQRDNYKEVALRYQKQLVEMRKNPPGIVPTRAKQHQEASNPSKFDPNGTKLLHES